MWPKIKVKTPHLSRWFDHVAALHECKSTVEELDLSARRKAIAAADGTADPKKGGGGETHSVDTTKPPALSRMDCMVINIVFGDLPLLTGSSK
jgi:hypothetical protein